MIDPERLAAFALMTTVTSVVPGVSMLFVMGESVRRGWRSGAAALLGMQVGYLAWWLLAGLGLGTLAQLYPVAFTGLALAGALYIGWLGVFAIHRADTFAQSADPGPDKRSNRSFGNGILVAIGNPKSLVYMVAMLPPFVDARLPVAPQIIVLALVAMVLDIAVGVAYIAAGQRLASGMERPDTARKVHLGVGTIYIVIALGLIVDLLTRSS